VIGYVPDGGHGAHVVTAGGCQHNEDSDSKEPDILAGDGGKDGEDVLQDRQAMVLLPVEQSQPGAVLCNPVSPAYQRVYQE